MTAELNRRITIKSYTTTQDAGGGSTSTESASYSMWAKVEDRTGQWIDGQGQLLWKYDYKITVRHELSRIIKSNMIVQYDGKKLLINSVAPNSEGIRKYDILRCSAIDNNV